MADLIFVAVICAFFALCVLYIRWCDRIVGPDEFAPPVLDSSGAAAEPDGSVASPVAAEVTR